MLSIFTLTDDGARIIRERECLLRSASALAVRGKSPRKTYRSNSRSPSTKNHSLRSHFITVALVQFIYESSKKLFNLDFSVILLIVRQKVGDG